MHSGASEREMQQAPISRALSRSRPRPQSAARRCAASHPSTTHSRAAGYDDWARRRGMMLPALLSINDAHVLGVREAEKAGRTSSLFDSGHAHATRFFLK